MLIKPFEKIKQELPKEIPSELIKKLPDKWEKIGDIAIITLPSELYEYREIIGKTFSKIINCKSILNDTGGISGELRMPNVELIYGDKNTTTIHKENGVRFKLDPTKVMFSSGNMDERLRMATVSNHKETVVDLFAGIGYFALPIAVHSKPRKIFACEKNPISYDYLCENIVLNNVTSIVEPLKGDNRKIAPKNVADRVIMGYLNDTHKFLQTGFDCLKNYTGIIHFHDKFSEKTVPDNPINMVKKAAEKYNKSIKLLKYKQVKSYAPGISHYVFDIKIG